MRRWIGMLLLAACLPLRAQQFTGTSGLLHVPSGEMNAEGTAQLGATFLNRTFTPDALAFDGVKYHTLSYYLSVTPYPWVEVAYSCTLLKGPHRDKATNVIPDGKGLYNEQDRYFSVKLQPLREGRFWPSLALGANDPIGTYGTDEGSLYFNNFYAAASKHFAAKAGVAGVHLAYRYFRRPYNRKWNGVVGGVTFVPTFAPQLRAVVEYTGDGVNVGADALAWRHWLLQAILQDGKYLSAGVAFRLNLL